MSMKRDDVSRVNYFHGLSLSCLVLKAVESAKKYVTGCDQQWSQFSVVEKGTEAWMTVASSAAVCDKGFIPVWPASIRNFTMFFSLRGQLFSILEWRWQVVRGRVPWRLKVRSIHCTSIVTLWWTSIMLYYKLLQRPKILPSATQRMIHSKAGPAGFIITFFPSYLNKSKIPVDAW